MNLVSAIEQHAKERPRAPALVYGEQEVSFAELERSVCRLANGLARLGIREGDRVGIMLPNTPEFVYAFFGCQKIGAVAVPFNTMYRGREILHILRDSGARALVCLTNSVAVINEIRSELPALEHVITTGERTLTLADPSATYVLQAVVGEAVYSSADDAYRRVGSAIRDGLIELGVEGAVYVHRGAVRVGERKIAGVVISEVEDLYVINALCFMDSFDPADFLTAVWVPPEVKDKMVEPLTSVREHTGTRPSFEQFRGVMAAALARAAGVTLAEGTLSREEKFGYEKQRALLARAAGPTRREGEGGERRSLFARMRSLFTSSSKSSS